MELSKLFGVERDAEFGVKGYEKMLLFKIILHVDGTEYLMSRYTDEDKWHAAVSYAIFNVIRAAPAGIIHLPPQLTDEQREQLKALYKIGYRYLTRTTPITIVAHAVKPRLVMNELLQGGLHAYIPYENVSVYRLPIKNDSEPFDIGKALGVGE
jgi:hypothetical protein